LDEAKEEAPVKKIFHKVAMIHSIGS
jgi:hypothetical protein